MKFKSYHLWILISIFLFVVGIVVGMLMGTYAVIDHVAHGLAGSTFTVSLNETKLVDYTMEQFNKTILPQLNITNISK